MACNRGDAFLESVCTTTINPVATAAAFVRTRLQKKLRGYYPELSHSGDFEMCMRFATRRDRLDGTAAGSAPLPRTEHVRL